jgi:hypothetical protein
MSPQEEIDRGVMVAVMLAIVAVLATVLVGLLLTDMGWL